MTDKLSERLEALAALRRAAPLHSEAATEAAWLEEAAELARRVEWRPIESAPRDGTAILVTSTYIYGVNDANPVWAAAYETEGPHPHPYPISIADYEPLYDATHWMPLPEPPEVG